MVKTVMRTKAKQNYLNKIIKEFQWTHPLISVRCYDVAFFNVNNLKLQHLRNV